MVIGSYVIIPLYTVVDNPNNRYNHTPSPHYTYTQLNITLIPNDPNTPYNAL